MATVTATAPSAKRRRLRPRRVRWMSNPKLMAGLILVVFFLLVIVAHPVFQSTIWDREFRVYDPAIGYDARVIHPSGPSADHWLGTDSLGRDVVSMFTYSARYSVVVALAAGLTIGVVSLLLGSIAAYKKGLVDSLITHFSDAMVFLPAILAVWIIGIGADSTSFGALEVGVTFGVIYGLGPATATVRASAMSVMAKPFIDAARLAGAGMTRTVTRHMLPHLVPHAAVQAMIGIAGAVTAEAFLAFRSGVGDNVGFGYLVFEGLTYGELFSGVLNIPWWMMITGAVGITLLAGAFYLIGVGLREVFDPHSLDPRSVD
ncbi:MAG TPA: ABC transporter permease [Acidimicrobiia bacterium]|nr:ABC transporter permease [Acidimicrobiia bacterium]